MKTPVLRLLLLAALAAVLAACGSKGSSPGTANEPTGGGGVNGISVGNCLNEDENFLVQPSSNALDGQSPGGVTFTLTFYRDEAAAKAAAAKKSKKFTAVVENGVVDFRGNPTIYAGAPPAKISKVELVSIKRCIDKAKSG
jgi:ABC-type glycerol-3-phosphate transport system substrate-binding protein